MMRPIQHWVIGRLKLHKESGRYGLGVVGAGIVGVVGVGIFGFLLCEILVPCRRGRGGARGRSGLRIASDQQSCHE